MTMDQTARVGRARRRITTIVGVTALLPVGTAGTALATTITPDDTSVVTTSAGSAETTPTGSVAPGEMASIAVTLTDSSIDGLPDDLVAGVVDVTVTDEAGRDLNFGRVEPGTDPATFATGVAAVIEGQPFPDYLLNNAGVVGHGMITLDEGEYMVFTDPAEEGGDIITAPLNVGPGDNDAVIPPSDGGSIRAGDYLFDVDVTAGGSTVTFTNSSDNQFHHVVVTDWGTNDPALVEENFPAMLEGDQEAPLAAGIDPEQVNLEFASSAVFGPGSSGTFEATFEEGHTYSAVVDA